MDISTAGTTGPRASRTATWRPSAGAARPNWRMAGWRCSPPWVAAWRVPALGGACWMLVDGFNWFLSNNLMGFCTKHHKKNTKPPINRSDFQEFNTEGILPTRVSLHAQSSCQSTSASLAICRGGLKDFVAECAEANPVGFNASCLARFRGHFVVLKFRVPKSENPYC